LGVVDGCVLGEAEGLAVGLGVADGLVDGLTVGEGVGFGLGVVKDVSLNEAWLISCRAQPLTGTPTAVQDWPGGKLPGLLKSVEFVTVVPVP
jgi:hypothetical protein